MFATPRIASPARRFARDERGNVAMMFGLTLVPLLFMVGSAVDYARGSAEREHLVQALDATGLALAHDAKTLSDAAFTARANQIFSAMYRSKEVSGVPTVVASRNNGRITVRTAADVPTTFMRLAGVNTMTVNANAAVNYGTKKLEIALVLDNTGSMGQMGKMAALKVAATDFLNQLAATNPAAGDIRVSIVPFSTQVRLPVSTYNASWLNPNGQSQAAWKGCVTDRDQDYDVNASSGATYPAVPCAWPNPVAPTQSELVGLTDLAVPAQLNDLRNRVNAMTPNGNTNITIGLSWGLAQLTPGAPLSSAANFGQTGVEKFVVLLTDGDNTQSRWSNNTFSIDQRTRMACNAVKDPSKKITVFSIRVIAGNANLLRDCATSPGFYYEAADASQIQPAFQAILKTITAIHLAS
jgi:Flp pilus assembly protein TadG